MYFTIYSFNVTATGDRDCSSDSRENLSCLRTITVDKISELHKDTGGLSILKYKTFVSENLEAKVTIGICYKHKKKDSYPKCFY